MEPAGIANTRVVAGRVMFRPDNRNAVVVLRVTGSWAETLYLDNVDPAFVGTTFEHSVDYLAKAYSGEPKGWP